MNTASTRLYTYILKKIEQEPAAARADLSEDLAEFLPDDPLAERLRAQARILRELDRETHVLRLSLQPVK